MSRKCLDGCNCGRHTADHSGARGPRPAARTPVSIQRIRELAPVMSRAAIAAELNVSRKVIDSRMAEHGIQGQPQSMTWAAKHKRLRKARGPAAAHSCVKCAECETVKTAYDWAQIHGQDGSDPWADFIPLCRACHLCYDRAARQSPEALARWRASAGPAIAAAWTPERRAAQSERARQKRLERPHPRDLQTGRFTG